MRRHYLASLNTWRGLVGAARTEAAVRQELVLLAVEMLNTAIEKLADHVSPEWRRNIGAIKDYGSAAVFFALCVAALVWIAACAVRFDFV